MKYFYVKVFIVLLFVIMVEIGIVMMNINSGGCVVI
jgi:hypothetical protein